MSMSDLEAGLAAVRASDRGRFAGPRPEELIERAEAALGVRFPPSFRRFVAELGAGSVGGHEFYGVTTDNFASASVPNGVWLTLDERAQLGLPEHLVLVGETGLGEYYALDTSVVSDEGESPVIVWSAGGQRTVVAEDFGSFFWSGIQDEFGPR